MAHPCNQCEFEATSARQLSRHKAVTHVKNPLSCILCPFVTAYQTNLLRHRREVHGILGTKGNKSCKFCGFEAVDNDTLILHQKQAHEDILKSARERFAREKKSARGNVPSSSNSSSVNGDYGDLGEAAGGSAGTVVTSGSGKKADQLSSLSVNNANLAKYAQSLYAGAVAGNGKRTHYSFGEQFSAANSNDEEDDDEDFWKEGFIDNPPSLVNFNYSDFHADRLAAELAKAAAAAAEARAKEEEEAAAAAAAAVEADCMDDAVHVESRTKPEELNPLDEKQLYGEAYSPNSGVGSDYGSSRPSSPFNALNSSQNSDSMSVTGKDGLAPTRIRRQYTCPDCDYVTVNPRSFLYHRRDEHGQKVKIVECPYCVYACQYFQKLQRHMLLVHKLQTSITPPGERSPEAAEEDGNDLPSTPNNNSSVKGNTSQGASLLRKAVMGTYDTRAEEEMEDDEIGEGDETEEPMQPDEMDPELLVDMRKHLFRCADCDYISNVEYLYEKHFRFHRLEARQCPQCEFRTQFPASYESHLTSHRDGSKPLTNGKHQVIKTEQGERDTKLQKNGSSVTVASVKLEAKKMPVTGTISYIRKTAIRPASVSLVSMKQCKKCPFKTDTFSKLEKHEACFHRECNFQCPLCESPFDALPQLQRHLTTTHANDRQATDIVSILELVYPRTPGTKVATVKPITHTIQPARVINVTSSAPCSVTNTPNTTSMSAPISTQSVSKDSKDKDTLYSRCETCGYRTRWRSELQRHMRVHTNVRPFACPHCEYRCKWKGDMNRHVLKFHRGAPSVPILVDESSLATPYVPTNGQSASVNTSTAHNSSNNATSTSSQNNVITISAGSSLSTKVRPQKVEEEGPLLDDAAAEQLEAELTARAAAENKVKVYRCTYCDFSCSTASRFHVHYVQHLNTKPFMCSVCHHRSNWEWDVTKHIKMKSQRDTDHANAKPVLIHESGRRNYTKYSKFVHLVPASEAPNEQAGVGELYSNASARSYDGSEELAPTSHLLQAALEQQAAQQAAFQAMEDDPESIVITPDISFTIGESFTKSSNKHSDSNTSIQRVSSTHPVISAQSSVSHNTVAITPNANIQIIRPSKLFYCAYCDYTHRDSKSLVSHLSIHAGRKPFKCRRCGFSSNWREVLSRHVASRHNGNGGDIEQLFKYTVSKYICRIIDETGLINPGPEVTTQADVRQPGQPGFAEAMAARGLATQGSLIQPSSSNTSTSSRSHASGQAAGGASNDSMVRHPPLKVTLLKPSISLSSNSSTPAVTTLSPSLISTLLSKQYFSPVTPKTSGGNAIEVATVLDSNGATRGNAPPSTPSNAGETPLVLQKHGISGRVSGFKGTHKCALCPFRAEKAFHMDFHLKRHTKLPGADFKCPHCPYWVNAKKSLVKHIYLHKYEHEIEGDGTPSALEEDEQEEFETDDQPKPKKRRSVRCALHCSICAYVGSNEQVAEAHRKMHNRSSGAYHCEHCDFTVSYQRLLTLHMKVHSSNYTAPACDCDYTSGVQGVQQPEPSMMELQAEQLLNELPSYWMDKALNTDEPRGGVKRPNLVKMFNCRFCELRSDNEFEVISHQQKHLKSGEQFKCAACDHVTRNALAYLVHMKAHESDEQADEEDEPICEPATRLGKDNEEDDFVPPVPEIAMEEETGESEVPSKQLPALRDMSYKRTIVRNEYPANMACYEEALMYIHNLLKGKTFGDGVMVEADVIRYSARRVFTYICSHCPAAFKSANDLSIHAILHQQQVKNAGHSCLYCNYRANNKPRLVKHLLVHTPDYVARRANCYPGRMKLVVGEAYQLMMNELSGVPLSDNESDPQFDETYDEEDALTPAAFEASEANSPCEDENESQEVNGEHVQETVKAEDDEQDQDEEDEAMQTNDDHLLDIKEEEDEEEDHAMSKYSDEEVEQEELEDQLESDQEASLPPPPPLIKREIVQSPKGSRVFENGDRPCQPTLKSLAKNHA